LIEIEQVIVLVKHMVEKVLVVLVVEDLLIEIEEVIVLVKHMVEKVLVVLVVE